MDFDGAIIAHGESDVDDFLEVNKDSILIILVSLQPQSLFLYRIIAKYQVPYVLFGASYIPGTGETSRALRIAQLRMALISKDWQRIVRYIARFTKGALRNVVGASNDGGTTAMTGIPHARYYLQVAQRVPMHDARVNRDTKIIPGHMFDFDVYLKYLERQRAGQPIESVRHCVFLDEYFPFHPDAAASWMTRPVKLNPEEYYAGMNRFFDHVEERIGLPVVIAAHPRARYDQHPDFFNGRPVFRMQTVDLVARSALVIAHASTAINFAVMFTKPITFVTSNAIKDTFYQPRIVRLAEAFKKIPINVDNALVKQFDPVKEQQVYEPGYQAYMTDYIKVPGSPEKLLWAIVADELEKDAELTARFGRMRGEHARI